MTAFHYMTQDNLPYDVWFHCAKEIDPVFDNPPAVIEWVKLDDCELTPELLELAVNAAAKVIALLENDKSVLISCIEGRNRSALVVALALLQMGYKNPISILRFKRHAAVLSNQSFCAAIRKA